MSRDPITDLHNKLQNQSSPYLQSRSQDLIQWYPWGREPLAKAAQHNKPLFVSVGYQSCHWCQAMGIQVFRDTKLAQLLNQDFIAILIDKDERPDLAHHFLKAASMTSGHSGWPLTVFCTPTGKPFFAATYLPLHSSKGMPGLMSIVPQASRVWKEKKESVEEDANKIFLELFPQEPQLITPVLEATQEDWNLKFEEDLKPRMDLAQGGFDKSPKFPNLPLLLNRLECYRIHNNSTTLNFCHQTLRAMSSKGMYDHVGGGFFRYCVDEKWIYPHFEKLALDNAWMIFTLVEFYKESKKTLYKRIADETIVFMNSSLLGEDAYFYSGVNADSEGREGAHYLWRAEEIFHSLGTSQGIDFCEWFGLNPQGNFPNEEGTLDGLHHLGLETSLEDQLNPSDMRLYQSMREKLRLKRETREQPIIENKKILEFNAISALALIQYGTTFDHASFAKQGLELLDRITQDYLDRKSRVLTQPHFGSFVTQLIDSASLIFAHSWASTLLEGHLAKKLRAKAHQLLQSCISQFWDNERGGFFSCIDNLEYPRHKEFYDSSLPSPNSLLAWSIHLLNHDEFESYLDVILNAPLKIDPDNPSFFGIIHMLRKLRGV